MKIAVIICEYNPLQKGHVYHIQKTKADCMCDRVVCIMSGNFVQRGEAAIADKYTRAKWAVQNGADMVVELSPEYVLTTAKYFALGAVKTANTLKGEKILSFGSENGNIDELKKALHFQENADFQKLFESYMKSGKGYAASYSLALRQLDSRLADILSSPNNILATEYLRALDYTSSDMVPYTLKRIGDYNDASLKNGFASASAIRCVVANGNIDSAKDCIPQEVYEYIASLSANYWNTAHDKLLAVLKYNFSKLNAAKAHGVKEGIENRIAEHLKTSSTFASLVSSVATKRYTDAYIRRTLLNIVLDNEYSARQLADSPVDHVNVLAIADDAKALLSQFACRVITKGAQTDGNSLSSKCDNLYAGMFKSSCDCMQIVKKLR